MLIIKQASLFIRQIVRGFEKLERIQFAAPWERRRTSGC